MIAPNWSSRLATESTFYFEAEDPDTILTMLVAADAEAETKMSLAYGQVKDTLRELGWTSNRLGHAIGQLKQQKRIWISKSGRSASLKKFRRGRTGHCVYCRARVNDLTRDHVIPKCQGGSDAASNLVMACKTCNSSKGGRTPEQWANDILRYRKPVRSLPVLHRIRMAINLLGGAS